MQALTLTELQSLNRAVESMRRGERRRLHRIGVMRWTDGERTLFDDLHRSGLISLMPDEDEIHAQERRNMRSDLLASYASRHPAGETYRGWLVRIANSGLRGKQIAAEILYPDDLSRCEHCGAIDDCTMSADRRESPHAKYCPVRSSETEPEPETEPETAPSLPSLKSVRADAREAGANMLHRVIVTDERTGAETVVCERRSAHRYNFALCRWVSRGGERTIIVDGWSRSASRRIAGCFPVAVARID